MNKHFTLRTSSLIISFLLVLAGFSKLTAQTNTVSGTFFLDNDLNASLSSGDIPQMAIRVYIYEDVNADQMVDPGDLYIMDDFTDAVGEFSFDLPFVGPTKDYVMEAEVLDLSAGFSWTTDNVEIASFNSSGNTDIGNDFGFAGENVGCFTVADDGDNLWVINRFSGENRKIGHVPVNYVEAISHNQDRTILYGVDANQMGSIDKFTAAFTPLPFPFGSGNGVYGNVNFSDADGLYGDQTSGEIYATQRRGGRDLLFKVDQVSGKKTPNAFGMGLDYVPIAGVGIFQDIDDLTIDPTDGQMYAIANDGGPNYQLIKVDKTSGLSIIVGPVAVRDMEGLGFTDSGVLYGTTGNQGGSDKDSFFRIDKTSGVTTLISPFNADGDYESCECKSGPVIVPPLPIVMQSFEAFALDGAVLLEWATATELGNDYFTIERSQDGSNFEEIGTEAGAGNSNSETHYNFTDPKPLQGTSYYRLKQTDFDGKNSWSEIVNVSISSDSEDLVLWPNPASDLLNLQFSSGSRDARIEIREAGGKLVFLREYSQIMDIQLELEDFRPGMYILEIKGTAYNAIRKLVIN